MNDQLDLFAPKRMHRKPTQVAKILEYLQTHGSITAFDAIREFKCLRLAARIFELRHEYMYDIEEISERHEGGTHSRYILK